MQVVGYILCRSMVRSKLTGITTVLPLRLKKKYGIETSYIYVDIWPLQDPMVYIFDPDIAQQVAVDRATPKHPILRNILIPLVGHGDIISSDGAHWKKWRSVVGIQVAHDSSDGTLLTVFR